MSGSTIGGVVGGVIGFYFGGPSGAQLGFAIGSGVGSYLDPQVLQGPQLGDIPVQTSQEGVPRPIVYGSPQFFPGNIIMTGPKVFSTKETEQGKGGGPIIESEEVHQTYAIRICEGPAICRKILRDGKLVYDRTGTAVFDADSAVFSSKVVLYEGDETQLPSPVLEGLPAANGGGVGNVCAHRGTAYMVIELDNLTPTGGRIPNYEFLMSSRATISPGDSGAVWVATTGSTAIGFSPDGFDWTEPYTVPTATGGRFLVGNGVLLKYSGSDGRYSVDGGETWSPDVADMRSNQFGAYLSGKFWLIEDGTTIISSPNGSVWDSQTVVSFSSISAIGGHDNLIVLGDSGGRVRCSDDGGDTWGGVVNVFGGHPITAIGSNGSMVVAGTALGTMKYTTDGVTWTTITTPFALQGDNFQQITRIVAGDNGVWVATSNLLYGVDGQSAYSINGTGWTLATGTSGFYGQDVAYSNGLFVQVGDNAPDARVSTSVDGNIWVDQPNTFTGLVTLSSVAAPNCGGYALPDAPNFYVNIYGEICGPASPIVTPGAVYLSEIELDIADRCGLSASQFDVSEITAIEVEGFLIGKQMSGAAALVPLATAYFHDLPEYDLQIHARRRGHPSVRTFTDDDFVASLEDEDIRAQAIELPRKLNLYFSDPGANYAVVPVPAERSSVNVKATGIAAVQVPIVMDRDLAQQKAEIMLKCIYEESQGRLIRELPAYKHADLVASDAITYDDKRWLIKRLDQTEGTIKIEADRDRISNYTSTATANGVVDPSDPVSNLKGPTIFQALNLPRLLTQDNQPGMYIAATGLLPGWPGADIYLSADMGATEQLVYRLTARATMGRLAAAATSSSDPIIVTVFDNRDLEAASDDELTARKNAFSMTTSGTSEVSQFGNVSQNVDDDWELTAPLYRGQLETTPASHSIGDEFLLLDGAVKFLPLSSSLIGKTLIFRAVTKGTPPANNPTTTVVFQPLFTGPEDIEFLLDETGAQLLDETGANLLED